MVILYDSIYNSVFTSQVLQPILDQLTQDSELQATIISFETKLVPASFSQKITAQNPRLNLVILTKTRFFGRLSLIWPTQQLTKFLLNYLNIITPTNIITRGPLAAYVTIAALRSIWPKIKDPQEINLKIQARGLAAAEYSYTNRHSSLWSSLWHKWRTYELDQIEQQVYSLKCFNSKSLNLVNLAHANLKLSIEAVSLALKQYLTQNYGTDPELITLAKLDLPTPIDPTTIQIWRQKIRSQLQIPADKYIYCYSGSIKPWQCPVETIKFFKDRLTADPHSFLLILTTDPLEFQNLIQKFNLATHDYLILQIAPTQLPEYLAACDAGLVFRDQHILNWVSRPTKILEYQAVGLKIMHNHTIAILSS